MPSVQQPLRIVIAEDAVLLREGLVHLLGRFGHRVPAARGRGAGSGGGVLVPGGGHDAAPASRAMLREVASTEANAATSVEW